MHNAIELVEFDAAAVRFGFVRTILNVRASMDDHEYCLNFASAQALVFAGAMLQHVDGMQEQLKQPAEKTFYFENGRLVSVSEKIR